MKLIKLSKKDFNAQMRLLKSLSYKFELHVNNNSLTLHDGTFAYYTSDAIENNDEDISLNHIRFISSVKSHVKQKIKDGILTPSKLKHKISYFDSGIRRQGHTTDCTEVDIDSAYWETAYKLKVISGRIYRYGKTVPKKIRLIALGTLAKRTTIYKFDGKKLIKDRVELDKETEYFWNLICKQVSDIMTTVSASLPEKDYYFYWVDAIFVSRKVEFKVKSIFAKLGYGYKTKQVKRITFGRKKITVSDSNRVEDDRVFAISDGGTNKKFLEMISSPLLAA